MHLQHDNSVKLPYILLVILSNKTRSTNYEKDEIVKQRDEHLLSKDDAYISIFIIAWLCWKRESLRTRQY